MKTLRRMTMLVLLAAVLSPSSERPCAIADEVVRPDIAPARPNRSTQFRDRLIAGLQARLKSEIEFIDRVVAAVQAGKLPQRLVDQTFFWARQRSGITRTGRTQRPIIYFQFALALRAQRIGVAL
jgi:hypothetical protein